MRTAVVLFSGGMDSTVSAFWARERFDAVHLLSLEYGQRHWVELDAARDIAGRLAPTSHKIANIGPHGVGPRSLLTAKDGRIESDAASVVPGRNLLFLWAACVHAKALGAGTVVLGCNADDQAAYADCRPHTLDAMARVMSLGLEHDIAVALPLVGMTKAGVLREAQRLSCVDSVRASWSCYSPVAFGKAHEKLACEQCPACVKRAAAFLEVFG